MRVNKNKHSVKKSFEKGRSEDKKKVVQYIIRTIEKKTGFSISQLKNTRSQVELYKLGLKYVTTTNKAICEALGIPVEGGTRRKRELEKEGILKTSLKRKICPYTKRNAFFLTTKTAEDGK